MSGSWLAREPDGSGDGVRLFCFAHAGGGAALYQPWREPLLPDVEVCPVVPPGREARRRERPHTRMPDLVGPLHDALRPHLDRPFALLGHSVGAIVAYELARRLCAGARPPLCLFVSGRRAPHRPARRPTLHRLPADELLQAVAGLNGTPEALLRDRDLVELFIPCLRADLELSETYAPEPGPRLTCPVSALTGGEDPEVDLDEMCAWQDTTDGGFSLRVFHGDHFYLSGAPPELLAAVRWDVRRSAAAVG